MRYVEDRERSEELLRLALPLMGRQAAGFNPCSYALWYEHCAGLNPELSRKLEDRLTDRSPLTDEEVWQLYTHHILARHIRQCEGVRDELCQILQDTVTTTRVAGKKASDFDQALANHAEQLTGAQPAEKVQDTLVDLRSETGKMRAVTAELVAQLKARGEQVTELSERLQQRESQALLDSLTGLRNRRGFEEAARELALERGGLAGTAVMMIDIDHFKSVNDEHGHSLGDKVLRAVAHVLGTNIKGRDLAARVGGEEFAVLLPDTSLSGAAALGQQICSVVAHGRITRSDGRATIGQVTVSVGVAVGEQREALETVLEHADAALYRAKRLGRNRVEVAPPRPVS